MNDHVMVDIETLGIGPNAMIVQIGAVRFDPEGVGATFNFNATFGDGDMDVDTVVWWLRQSAEAQAAVFGQSVPRDGPLRQGLYDFVRWLFVKPTMYVWANSPSFDLALMKGAWSRHASDPPRIGGVSWPITPRMERDFRTLRTLGRLMGVEGPVRVGPKHDALSDARFQAEWAILVLRAAIGSGPASASKPSA